MAEKTPVAETCLRHIEPELPELRKLEAESFEAFMVSVALSRAVGIVYFAEVRPELPPGDAPVRVPDLRRTVWITADC